MTQNTLIRVCAVDHYVFFVVCAHHSDEARQWLEASEKKLSSHDIMRQTLF
jgi:hypothetical protein